MNCAALPDNLIEAEMFGHERGAYTDARESRGGLIEAAHGGTLFLDEIAELPLAGQAKLLAVMENDNVRRIGASRHTRVDVRILCATNQNLQDRVVRGDFRRDLFYRCRGLCIPIPPLRQRRDEIATLTRHLLLCISAGRKVSEGRRASDIAPEVLNVVLAYAWPGNIRELHHALTIALLNSEGERLEARHLPQDILDSVRSQSGNTALLAGRTEAHRRYVPPKDQEEERRNIVIALGHTRGHRAHAARELGMSRTVLWERLRYHRIDHAEWQS